MDTQITIGYCKIDHRSDFILFDRECDHVTHVAYNGTLHNHQTVYIDTGAMTFDYDLPYCGA